MSDNVAHALAGAGGGIVATVVTYPLNTISMRQQVARKNSDVTESSIIAAKKTIEKEGIKGLYSGLKTAVFGMAVTNGVYYYWYELTKSALSKAKNSNAITVGESLVAGAAAGAATVMVTNPIWLVNTRMTVKDGETDTKKTRSATEVVLKILKEDGPLAFWQGTVAALILVINPMIQYSVFENLKKRLEKIKTLGNLDIFMLGAISKLAATSITYPYITIKSRMQLKKSEDESERYNSLMDGFRKVVAREGVAGLYKGIHSKLLQSVLTASFLFMMKEALFKYAVLFLMLIGARPKAH